MSKRTDWWYSGDGHTGFCWASVVGYDWHAAGQFPEYIYVYLGSGILRVHGAEAAAVYAEFQERKGKRL